MQKGGDSDDETTTTPDGATPERLNMSNDAKTSKVGHGLFIIS